MYVMLAKWTFKVVAFEKLVDDSQKNFNLWT